MGRSLGALEHKIDVLDDVKLSSKSPEIETSYEFFFLPPNNRETCSRNTQKPV